MRSRCHESWKSRLRITCVMSEIRNRRAPQTAGSNKINCSCPQDSVYFASYMVVSSVSAFALVSAWVWNQNQTPPFRSPVAEEIIRRPKSPHKS